MDNFPPVDGGYGHVAVPYLAQHHPQLEYDAAGFLGFPDRKGWSTELLLNGDFLQGHSVEETAMMLQSWLFIGFLMDVCHVPLELEDDPCETENSELNQAQAPLVSEEVDASEEVDLLLLVTPLQKTLLRPDIRVLLPKMDGSFTVSLFSLGQVMLNFRHRAAGGAANGGSTWALQANAETATKLRHASYHASRVLAHPSLDEILDPVIQLSVQNLEGTLVWARFACWEPHLTCVTMDPSPAGYKYDCPRLNEFLRKRLLAAGWCVSEIATFRSIWSNRLLYFLSTMPRKVVDDHSECSELLCKFEIVDSKTYLTQHRTSNCSCKHVDISNQAQRFFQDSQGKEYQPGHYPVVWVRPHHKDSRMAEIQVLDSKEHKYVAISHVWAHGLGNPGQNSLPSCQLLRIQHHVDELWKEMDGGAGTEPKDEGGSAKPFWIDTLCVPLSPKERGLAILNMAQTYQEARSVLVLDKEIWEYEWKEETRMEELVVRMASCTWYRRLWTFQEGALARNLHFCFSNRSLDMKELQDSMLGKKTKYSPLEDAERYRFMMFLGGLGIEPDISSYRPLTKYWQCRTHIGRAAVWTSVQIRTTSRPEDEVICLASLLGFDYESKKALFKVRDVQERMRAFLLSPSLGSIPQDVVFAPWPKLRIDGVRWAPASFTRTITGDPHLGSVFLSSGAIQAPITGDGLLIRACSGIVLEPIRFPLFHSFFVAVDFGTDRETWWEVIDNRHWRDREVECWKDIGRRCCRAQVKRGKEGTPIEDPIPVVLLQGNLGPEKDYAGILGLILLDGDEAQESITSTVQFLATVRVQQVWGPSCRPQHSLCHPGCSLPLTRSQAVKILRDETECEGGCGQQHISIYDAQREQVSAVARGSRSAKDTWSVG